MKNSPETFALLTKIAGLAGTGRKALIGVSGGRDSVVLLHALHAAGASGLVICHLDHGLRGRESAKDAAFVAELADRLGFKCRSGCADVKKTAHDRRLSLEAAGRAARHEFFARCAAAERCRCVILAHHADDQAETVLLHLLRGAGLAGLAGMRERTLLRVPGFRLPLEMVRPLLGVSRAEIDAYAAAHRLKWREDVSNASVDHVRNRLRHEAVPLLNSIAGRNVSVSICRLADIAAAEEDYMAGASVGAAEAVIKDGAMTGRLLLALPEALQRRVIRLWLTGAGVPDCGLREIEAVRTIAPPGGPAGVCLPGGFQVRRSRGVLHLRSNPGP